MKKRFLFQVVLCLLLSLTAQAMAQEPGSLQWSFPTGGDIDSSPAIGLDGTIYVGSDDDSLYAIISDGSLKWAYETGGDVSSSPAIGLDGTIYFAPQGGFFYALNPDGTLNWKCELNCSISSPTISSGGTIYVGSTDNHLCAIEGSGSLANTAWPMFHHDLQHTGRQE